MSPLGTGTPVLTFVNQPASASCVSQPRLQRERINMPDNKTTPAGAKTPVRRDDAMKRFAALSALALLGAPGTASAQNPTAKPAEQTLGTVEVVDFRGTQMVSPKCSRDLQDTPRLITILNNDLLEEQGAVSLKRVFTKSSRHSPQQHACLGQPNPGL
jgi:outer membrane receptor for monomeric catechols